MDNGHQQAGAGLYSVSDDILRAISAAMSSADRIEVAVSSDDGAGRTGEATQPSMPVTIQTYP